MDMSNIVGGCGTMGKIVIALVVLAVVGLIIVAFMRGSQMRDIKSKVGSWLKASAYKGGPTHGAALKSDYKKFDWGAPAAAQ